nr:Mariner Mos1 transposase [Hymenolepis microstoma]
MQNWILSEDSCQTEEELSEELSESLILLRLIFTSPPRSMAHGLAHQHCSSYEEVKNWIDSWILSKDEKFFRRGIHLLPETWAKVVANGGQYCET